MLQIVKELYARTREAHSEIYTLLIAVQKLKQTPGAMTLEEFADAAYATDKAAKMLKDLEREMRLEHERIERLTCLIWTKLGDAAEKNIKTPYVTATPDVKLMAALPTRKKNPEEFKKLMKYLKIPECHIGDEDQKGIIDLNFRAMIEWLSDRQAQGLPLPPGIEASTTYPVYKLLLLSKEDPDAEV
jgi:hypothetical protein